MNTRFFFDVVGTGGAIDEEGTVLSGIHEARIEATVYLGGLLRDDPASFWRPEGSSVRVRDAKGMVLFEINTLANMAPNTGWMNEHARAGQVGTGRAFTASRV